MRSYRLADVAARAEALRWQRRLRRTTTRAAIGGIAALFGFAAFLLIHVLGIIALIEHTRLGALWSVTIVIGVDLVFALIFALVAARDTPDSVELEALEVRQRALSEIRSGLAVGLLFRLATRVVGKRPVYGAALAAVAARMLSGRGSS